MAEAYLNSKNQATVICSSNSTKKRKSKTNASTKLKRPNLSQITAVPIASTSNSSQSSLLKTFHSTSADAFPSTSADAFPSTSAAASNGRSTSSTHIQPSENAIDTVILQQTVGEVIRKTFFIGGQKYVIFWGGNGFITDI